MVICAYHPVFVMPCRDVEIENATVFLVAFEIQTISDGI
jgi:hypothetical protein